MVKRLALTLAVLCWLSPLSVYALGLGSIDMRSALNQPLDARIDLLRVRSGELKNLTVKLAASDTFRRAGIERPAYLESLKFNLMQPASGNPYIQITSAQPITEPFLNFLIEVNWANGRLLREFTVLVDPPVLTASTPAPIEAPATTTAQSEMEATSPATAPTRRPPPRTQASAPKQSAASRFKSGSTPKVSSTSNGGVQYRPTHRGDTLWEVARDMRSDDSVSIPQMMLALLENNPEAFYNDNVNNLKMGHVLRLDDTSTVSSVGKQEAARIVGMQWEQWKQTRGMVGSTPAHAGPKVTHRVAEGPRVKLVSPGDEETDETSGTPRPVASGSGEAAQLQNELTLAQEALDATKRETGDLKSRLALLEEQMQDMKRLIMLKDNQLVALQNQLQQAGEEPQMPAAEEVAATQEALEQQDAAAGQMDKEMADQTPEQMDNQMDSNAQPATAAAKPVTAPAPGLVSRLLGDPVIVGGLVAVLVALGIVGWMAARRRKMQQFQESILTGQSSVGDMTEAAMGQSEDASFMSDFAVSSMEGIQTDVNEVDPMSEADVYLAYGRYKQAEELINEAIENDPQRLELKLKLLEIHYAAKDKEAFELQAEMFRDSLEGDGSEMWGKVVEMGHELAPENPLFGGEAGAMGEAVQTSADLNDDEFADLDLEFNDAEFNDAADATEEALDLGDFDLEEEKKAEDGSLEFDLSAFEMDEESAAAQPAANAAENLGEETAKDDDNLLDFDLSGFEDFGQEKSEPATGQAQEQAQEASLDDNSLDFDLGGDSLTQPEVAEQDEGLDFDFGSMEEAEPFAANDQQPDDAVVGLDFGGSAESTGQQMEPSLDMELMEGGIDSELDDSLFADVDEVGTKLDLARAYIDMGDSDGAKSILDEVLEEGDDTQKQEAQDLMQQMA